MLRKRCGVRSNSTVLTFTFLFEVTAYFFTLRLLDTQTACECFVISFCFMQLSFEPLNIEKRLHLFTIRFFYKDRFTFNSYHPT